MAACPHLGVGFAAKQIAAEMPVEHLVLDREGIS